MKNKTILVIEDNDLVREATAQLLKCCCYPNVLQATNGQQGIQLIREREPDLAIIGLAVPGDGEEVIRWVSQEHKPSHPSIKTIALNGDDQHSVLPEAKAAGFDAFLPKLSCFLKVKTLVDSLLV